MPSNAAVSYTRVSTHAQAEEGISLDAQAQRIGAWCAAHGYELIRTETDAGISGGRADNRPALQRALGEVCRVRGVLVVYSLSRMARSTRDAIDIMERLHKSGADLVSLTENIDTTTAVGKLFFRMMAALAEFERDLISERTSAAMAHKQARGEYIGGQAPYGSRAKDGAIVPDEDEQRVIGMIRYMRQEGTTPAGIARKLNATHVPCRGSAWHPRTVSRILVRTE